MRWQIVPTTHHCVSHHVANGGLWWVESGRRGEREEARAYREGEREGGKGKKKTVC